MRTNNEKVKSVIIGVYFIMIVLAITSIFVFNAVTGLEVNPLILFLVVLGIFGILFFLVHRVAKYFEYDSDGAKLILLNKGLLLSDRFNYREHKLETSKHELVGFKMYNFFLYKELVVFIKWDGHERVKKYRFNITLVARKKRKYMKQSLSKTVKLNKRANN
ncbi:hypothetical protein [Hanstruepera ponticola]|uniref:hypothetical protein n=1 Tax=Hanstruepera ponticola TaxID=2042995 RepID=UPI00177A8602|nr:hypothetical protein [Hanstruepera ponticola]